MHDTLYIAARLGSGLMIGAGCMLALIGIAAGSDRKPVTSTVFAAAGVIAFAAAGGLMAVTI